jgi:beta-glucosidase
VAIRSGSGAHLKLAIGASLKHSVGVTTAQQSGFPPGFFWGTSTAAHQVEGDNRHSDWWECEQDGRLPVQSGEACRHYERYAEDFDFARSLGNNAHRFSIEWSRLEPEPGQWNEAALEHYRDVVRALRARGLEPVVTLHHFTHPAWFTRRGGWTRRDSVRLFATYVQRVAAALAPEVRWWITINEPTVYAKRALVRGDWPPCRPHPWWQVLWALRNLGRAHVAAYRILHAARADVQVGIAHSAPYVVPCRTHGLRGFADRLAAYLRDTVLNRAPFWLLGHRPRQVLDFIGLNYYTRQIVARSGSGTGLLVGVECKLSHHAEPRRFNSLGWEIYPAGLTGVLRRFARYGVPLMVTENGLAARDEAERVQFLSDHVDAVAAALRAGVPVLGYFYWTLFDNFEWSEGFSARFGLAALEPGTLRRVPRPVAATYAAICRANSVR